MSDNEVQASIRTPVNTSQNALPTPTRADNRESVLLVRLTRFLAYSAFIWGLLIAFFFELGFRHVTGLALLLGHFSAQLNAIHQKLMK